MSTTNKSSAEIAADITIALLEKMAPGAAGVYPENLAPRVAEAYRLIYAAVRKPVE